MLPHRSLGHAPPQLPHRPTANDRLAHVLQRYTCVLAVRHPDKWKSNADPAAHRSLHRLADVLQLVDSIGGQRQILVGSSLGGWLALHAALQRPHLVQARAARAAGRCAMMPAGRSVPAVAALILACLTAVACSAGGMHRARRRAAAFLRLPPCFSSAVRAVDRTQRPHRP